MQDNAARIIGPFLQWPGSQELSGGTALAQSDNAVECARQRELLSTGGYSNAKPTCEKNHGGQQGEQRGASSLGCQSSNGATHGDPLLAVPTPSLQASYCVPYAFVCGV